MNLETWAWDVIHRVLGGTVTQAGCDHLDSLEEIIPGYYLKCLTCDEIWTNERVHLID